MSNLDIHFSSENHRWGTPRWLFELLHAEFDFQIDLAADDDNALLDRYITREVDSLSQPWAELIGPGKAGWLNPPYGRGLKDWIAKADEEGQKGATIVTLTPARPDTQWYRLCWDYGEIRHLSGRLHFVGEKTDAAPFPSMITIFGPRARVGQHSLILVSDITPKEQHESEVQQDDARGKDDPSAQEQHPAHLPRRRARRKKGGTVEGS